MVTALWQLPSCPTVDLSPRITVILLARNGKKRSRMSTSIAPKATNSQNSLPQRLLPDNGRLMASLLTTSPLKMAFLSLMVYVGP